MRGLRALLFCITLQRNKSPINWTICLRNLLFNVKTADNRLIGGVIKAPKGIFPFGAYSFLYVLLSVNNCFFRKAVTINKLHRVGKRGRGRNEVGRKFKVDIEGFRIVVSG